MTIKVFDDLLEVFYNHTPKLVPSKIVIGKTFIKQLNIDESIIGYIGYNGYIKIEIIEEDILGVKYETL